MCSSGAACVWECGAGSVGDDDEGVEEMDEATRLAIAEELAREKSVEAGAEGGEEEAEEGGAGGTPATPRSPGQGCTLTHWSGMTPSA